MFYEKVFYCCKYGVFVCISGHRRSGCSALKTLELPASLTTPGWLFCTGCTALQTVTCKAETPPALESNAFDGVVLAGVTLKVPAASVGDYQNAPIWKDFKKPFVGL